MDTVGGACERRWWKRRCWLRTALRRQRFQDKVGDVKLAAMPGRMGRMGAGLAALPKAADGFYQSKEWLALRARRMADADYRAAKARASGGRVILDHISERRDGGADLDPANTQWLTMAEHQAKTARVRAERATRRGGGEKSGAFVRI